MEPTLAIRQPPGGRQTHRRSFFYSRTMVMCLCVAALSIPTAGICASTSSPLPLFVESPSDIPPAIAQAFPSPEMSKRMNQVRTLPGSLMESLAQQSRNRQNNGRTGSRSFPSMLALCYHTR